MKEEIEEIKLFPIDSAIDESLLDEHFHRCATIISMNERLDIDFIRKYKEKLDWKTLSINYQFCETELIEFIGWINWGSAVYTQNSCTKKFIKNNNLTSIIDDFEKYNKEFMTLSNEEYGNIKNILVIGEENRDIVYYALMGMINSRIVYDIHFPNSGSSLELMFDDGFIFHISYSKLNEMKRDLQLEIVLNGDNIIKAIRNTVEKHC